MKKFIKKLTRILPDKMYLKLMFRKHFHKQLNLNNPQTFNEKLQWLKLYDRKPIYTTMVDKYAVKKYVADIIGEEYIIPTLGVWDKFDDIDFDKLPNQFVLKTTHGSGGYDIYICKDKSDIDLDKAKSILENSLKNNPYWYGREWPYKNVAKKIIAEEYLEDPETKELYDYKIHSFNGEPKVILVCRNRYKETGLTEDFFDTNWCHLDIKRPNHPNSLDEIEKPEKLAEMVELSKKLSANIPFSRIDFYEIAGRIYFGEITLYPASGLAPFVPDEWDYSFGNWITLPEIKNKNE